MPLPGILGGLMGGLPTGNLGNLGMGAGSGMPTIQPTAPAPVAGNPMDRIGDMFRSGPMGDIGASIRSSPFGQAMNRLAPPGGPLSNAFSGAFRGGPFGFRR